MNGSRRAKIGDRVVVRPRDRVQNEGREDADQRTDQDPHGQRHLPNLVSWCVEARIGEYRPVVHESGLLAIVGRHRGFGRQALNHGEERERRNPSRHGRGSPVNQPCASRVDAVTTKQVGFKPVRDDGLKPRVSKERGKKLIIG